MVNRIDDDHGDDDENDHDDGHDFDVNDDYDDDHHYDDADDRSKMPFLFPYWLLLKHLL
jgi:hypothetical protein